MPLAQTKLYTEADYYDLPEDVRAELIEGNLIYNQAAPSLSVTGTNSPTGAVPELQTGSLRSFPRTIPVTIM